MKKLAALFFVFTAIASASHGEPSQNDKWDVTLGLGGTLRPTYEGSDSYTVSPLPYVKAIYNDMIQLGPDNVSAYWKRDNLKLGVGGVYHNGREDSDDSGIFSYGDDHLQGMGDIDGAFGAKAFASYQIGRIAFDAGATKLLGDDNDGILVDAGISAPYQVTERTSLTPHAGLTWANEDYMQTYFGVTPTQSAASGFTAYDAGAGIKHFDLGARVDYAFDQNWFISTDATVKFLTGDAADSPIVQSDTNATLLTFVGYRF